MKSFRFDAVRLPPAAEAMRGRVRAFLAAERKAGLYAANRGSWGAYNAEFSRRAGAAGFIGITLPTAYGGHGLSGLERFVAVEEMLAAGAPCAAHWVSDRQSGPQIARFGSERAKRTILPRIVAGDCFFAIGMSEPNSGSDLAATSTKATKVDGGWRIDGQKIWTTIAHHAHYLILLARTASDGERHAGLTQFIVDMAQPGVTVRPIRNMSGGHEFNEVFFDGYIVPDDMVMGQPGSGWASVTGELSFERSGPDRFLSDYRLLVELINRIGAEPDKREAIEIGRLISHLVSLRRMSTSIAGMLAKGEQPLLEAALVKDVGTAFERDIPEVARRLIALEPSPDDDDPLSDVLAQTILSAPAYTIRGGTREILRGMIARGLGLR